MQLILLSGRATDATVTRTRDALATDDARCRLRTARNHAADNMRACADPRTVASLHKGHKCKAEKHSKALPGGRHNEQAAQPNVHKLDPGATRSCALRLAHASRRLPTVGRWLSARHAPPHRLPRLENAAPMTMNTKSYLQT